MIVCIPPNVPSHFLLSATLLDFYFLAAFFVFRPIVAPPLFGRALPGLRDRSASCGVEEGSRRCAGLRIVAPCPVETSRWGILATYWADTLLREEDTALQRGSRDQRGGEPEGLSGYARCPLGGVLHSL